MIIYCAENLLDGKKYVGFTTCPLDKRKDEHYHKVKTGSTAYFHNALRCHGQENFKWSILYEDDNIRDDDKIETKHIIEQDSHWTKWGYNMTWGGEGGSLFGELNGRYGMEVSQETREKQSKSRTGKCLGDANSSAKNAGLYKLTYPDGHTEEIKNMRKWTRENGFKDDHRPFYQMCNGYRTKPYFGFWCERLEISHQKKVEQGLTESTVKKSKRERKEKFGIQE